MRESDNEGKKENEMERITILFTFNKRLRTNGSMKRSINAMPTVFGSKQNSSCSTYPQFACAERRLNGIKLRVKFCSATRLSRRSNNNAFCAEVFWQQQAANSIEKYTKSNICKIDRGSKIIFSFLGAPKKRYAQRGDFDAFLCEGLMREILNAFYLNFLTCYN